MKDTAVNTPIDPKTIKGWGIDADPENDPTYPMRRHRMNIGEDPQAGNRPDNLQPVDIEVLKSIERPNVSAVFGTPEPPSGLSGLIRRQTYKYSENEYKRWLPLVLADRVDVVEGVVADLLHGKLPNIWAEKGYNISWKYDRTNLIVRLATTALVTAGVMTWIFSGKDSSRTKREKTRKY